MKELGSSEDDLLFDDLSRMEQFENVKNAQIANINKMHERHI